MNRFIPSEAGLLEFIFAITLIAVLGGASEAASELQADDSDAQSCPQLALPAGIDFRAEIATFEEPLTYGDIIDVFGHAYEEATIFGQAISYDISPWYTDEICEDGALQVLPVENEIVEILHVYFRSWGIGKYEHLELAEKPIAIIVRSFGDEIEEHEILWPKRVAGAPTKEATDLIHLMIWEELQKFD